MENFVVSARKYRPVNFDMVVGQNSITTTLKNAIKNEQIAQAFLFCGPRGVGKTTCARILAKTINCENLSADIEPCNECAACKNFNVSASFNIHELDAASNNKVEDIRALVEQVRIPPQGVKYKVYIIDEVHMLSQSAFNAFLKTLEEPPPYAKFILATTEKHKILPTIISRCQVFDFKRISTDDMAKQMLFVAEKEAVEAELDALHLIAQKADGSMRDALSIFDQIVSFTGNKITYQAVIDNLNILDFEYYFKLTNFLLNGNIFSSLLLFNEVIENGFDGQYFLSGLGQHFRNLLVAQDRSTAKLLESGDNLKNRYIEQSSRCTAIFLLKSLEQFSNADFNYKESNNKRLLVELTLSRVCALMKFDEKTDNRQATANTSEATLISTQPPTSVEAQKIKQGAEKTIIAKPEVNKEEKKISKIPVVKISSTSELPGTISITETIKQASKVSEQKTESTEEILDNAFTQDDLLKQWDIYKELYKEKDKNLYAVFKSRTPELKEGLSIELIVENKVQEQNINKIFADMLNFLKTKLKNTKIEFNIIVAENTLNTKPFTASEKFKKFAEENPAIEQLKNQLDLDLDI